MRNTINVFIFIIWNLVTSKCHDNMMYNTIIDPEIYMNVTEIIKFYGYPCINYEAITDDGYILSIQRIPYGLKHSTGYPRPVVFLQHGLVDSSFTWVNNGPNKSLAFILADSGFDVWLGNSRGNVYSNKHISFPSDSNRFWDFSWDEMVKYDLSASIEHVLSVAGAQKLSYIGHSQGTEIILAKLSQYSSLNEKISSVVTLAPVAYLGHVRSGIRYLASVAGGFDLFIKLFNHGEFLPNSLFTQKLAEYVCGKEFPIICSNLLFLLAGYDTTNLNYTRLPIYLAHIPAGTSSKNMVHYAQAYKSDKFQMYDYGYIRNLIKYRQFHPPKYVLNTHGVPVAVFWGGNDWLASYEDVKRTVEELGDNVKFNKFILGYNHMDFIWGENAANVIYQDVIDFINKYQ